MADSQPRVTGKTIILGTPITKIAKLKRVGSFLASGFFWMWQIAFLVLSLFALMPHLLPEVWVSYRYYDMPLHYFLLTVFLITLPLICLGVITWLMSGSNNDSTKLVLNFFYGFELPILFLSSVYILNMRDYGAGMLWMLLTVAIAACTWCVMVFYERSTHQPQQVMFANNPVATFGSTVIFAVGILLSLAVMLFIIPLLVIFLINIADAFITFDWSSLSLRNILATLTSMNWSGLFSALFHPWAIVIIAALVLVLTSTTLIIAMPFVLIYLYIGQFITRFRHSPSLGSAILAALVLVILTGVHFKANQQPQQPTFALLENQPQSETAQHKLVDQSEFIREGLLNAYLARYRYFSSTGSASLLTDNYKEAFSLEGDIASYPQQLLNLLLTPILYDGDNRTDPERAAELYEQFFDAPIQKAELDEIWRTLKYNSQSSVQNAAGLLDVSQESVYLANRSINIHVEQQLATIRVTQKMVNKVTQLREAVMHFSLPDYAVITGVWLSDNENQLEKHAPLVAPRGAAQMVYNQQVSRRIDPALLEKVGPELYRLRVYPILRATREYATTPDITPEIIDGKPMFVTFEYQTLANKQDAWPIPKLLEKRHLFWNENTVTTVNGDVVASINNDDWLPIQAGLKNTVKQAPTQLPLSAGVSVWAIPSSYLRTNSSTNSTSLLKNTVVLIDGSRSMSTQAPNVSAAITQMSDADIYFCQATCVTTTPSDVSERVYYGNSKPIQQLESYLSTASTQTTNRIIILTDDGSYEAESNTQTALLSQAPIWVLHLGGSQLYAYSDVWLTTVNQSGGGFTTTDVAGLLAQLSQLSNPDTISFSGINANTLNNHTLTGNNADWLWFSGNTTNTAENDIYAKLGAAMRISTASKSGKTLQLEQLDELHLQAIKAQIVTELSSMIVLVNDQQKKALENASNADDRFDRENEDGTQLVGVPGDSLSVAAVPEPHEWALLLVVLLFASISLYQRRQTQTADLRGPSRQSNHHQLTKTCQ